MKITITEPNKSKVYNQALFDIYHAMLTDGNIPNRVCLIMKEKIETLSV